MAYKEMSKAEKIKFAKKFPLKERKAYRKGQRNGYLKRVFMTKKTADFTPRSYSKEQINALFDDLNNVKWK